MSSCDPICALLERLQGDRVPLDELVEGLGGVIDLLPELQRTEQDPGWHGEGDVAAHIELVLEALEPELAGGWTAAEAQGLRLAALLHDVAKPLVTRRREIDGASRVVAPRHAERGASYLAFRLPELGLPPALHCLVMALVRHHHDPISLVLHERQRPPGAFAALCRRIDPRSLLALCAADLRGRVCDDLEQQLELLELCRLGCEEAGGWDPARLHAGFIAGVCRELSGAAVERQEQVIVAGIRDLEAGVIHTPEEAVARARNHPAGRRAGAARARLVVTCGPSGCGKSAWVSEQRGGQAVISLDAIREELTGDRADQGSNAAVVKLARERLKVHLRAGDAVIWDATGLRRDLRRGVLETGRAYGAHTTLVVFSAPLSALEARNRGREHAVSAGVLRRQLRGYEWPDIDEAERVIFIDAEGAVLRDTRAWWRARQ